MLDLLPNAPTAIVWSLAPADLALGGGCALYVDLAAVALVAGFVANGAGFAEQGYGVPATSAVLGARVFVQAAGADPRGPVLGLGFSGGLALVLGR